MEDFYCFPNSLETTTTGYVVDAGFPGHVASHGTPSPRPRRTSRDGANASELRQHYLDACFRCGRHLGGNKDIFMYRGDTPFCSEDCRQQQIDADEAREKRSKQQPAAAAKSERRQRQRQSGSPPTIPLWAR